MADQRTPSAPVRRRIVHRAEFVDAGASVEVSVEFDSEKRLTWRLLTAYASIALELVQKLLAEHIDD